MAHPVPGSLSDASAWRLWGAHAGRVGDGIAATSAWVYGGMAVIKRTALQFDGKGSDSGPSSDRSPGATPSSQRDPSGADAEGTAESDPDETPQSDEDPVASVSPIQPIASVDIGSSDTVMSPLDDLECDQCRRRFSTGIRFCPYDGGELHGAKPEAPSDALLGSVIDGRYQVLQVLGSGGMGIVYKVRHVKLVRDLAMKVLREDVSRDRDVSERFLREARAAALVNHPGVVKILDFGELPNGRPFFIMELLEGEPLASLIRRDGALSVEQALSVTRQVADALGAAQARGIIHRDLKPDNIQVIACGQRDLLIKVVDFGLALITGQNRLTQQGIVFGTPHYMSPEQAVQGPIDGRSDVYTLGLVMHEMVTARPAFDGDTYKDVLDQQRVSAPPPLAPAILESESGRLFNEIMSRCLEKDPIARFPSMRAVLARLDEVGCGSNGVTPATQVSAGSPRLAQTVPPIGRARRTAQERVILLAGLVLAVGGGVLWWMAGTRDVAEPKAALHDGLSPPPAKQAVPAPIAAEKLDQPGPVGSPSPGSESPESEAAPQLDAQKSGTSQDEPRVAPVVGGVAAEAPAPAPMREAEPEKPVKRKAWSKETMSEIVDPWAN